MEAVPVRRGEDERDDQHLQQAEEDVSEHLEVLDVLPEDPADEDFGEIARLSLGDDEADLEAEAAYTELVEFVRVSVQLMFEDLYEVRRRLAAASMH